MKLAQKIAVGYLRYKLKLVSAISKKKAASQAFELFCTPPTRDLKTLPSIFREADEIQFSFHGYQIIGYRWNKGGQKKVLIVHGFESTAINFEQYIQPFIHKGYEVLAFDGPAHGRSSGRKITAVVYKDLVKYVCEQYGPIHSFMGHSFGAFALSLALAEIPHDERFRAVFIAPSSETSTAIDQFFQFLHLDANVRKEFDQLVAVRAGQPVDWFTVDRAMTSIKARILWLHDEGDNVTPLRDALKVKEKNHPNVQFVITTGLGHSRIYRDAEVARQVVDFL